MRELKEETGNDYYKISSFIGVCENIFSINKDVLQQEVNIIFKVEVPKKNTIISNEKNLEIITKKKGDLFKIINFTIGINESIQSMQRQAFHF